MYSNSFNTHMHTQIILVAQFASALPPSMYSMTPWMRSIFVHWFKPCKESEGKILSTADFRNASVDVIIYYYSKAIIY